jgi:hypothetical protein
MNLKSSRIFRGGTDEVPIYRVLLPLQDRDYLVVKLFDHETWTLKIWHTEDIGRSTSSWSMTEIKWADLHNSQISGILETFNKAVARVRNLISNK